MPHVLASACAIFGCPERQPCPLHHRAPAIGTASARGYGARWRRHRERFRSEQFRQGVPRAGLCGARLRGAPLTHDSACAAAGLIVAGVVADHIVPVTGPDDPSFFDLMALQFLCITCDAMKRQREAQHGGGHHRVAAIIMNRSRTPGGEV